MTVDQEFFGEFGEVPLGPGIVGGKHVAQSPPVASGPQHASRVIEGRQQLKPPPLPVGPPPMDPPAHTSPLNMPQAGMPQAYLPLGASMSGPNAMPPPAPAPMPQAGALAPNATGRLQDATWIWPLAI